MKTKENKYQDTENELTELIVKKVISTINHIGIPSIFKITRELALLHLALPAKSLTEDNSAIWYTILTTKLNDGNLEPYLERVMKAMKDVQDKYEKKTR